MTRARAGGWDATGFGRRLKELREQAELTQRQLVDRLAGKLSVRSLSKLEVGRAEPLWPLVLLLANALGCTPNDFIQPAALDPPPDQT